MFSQRSREGYLLFDHQASPGIPAPLVERTGLAPDFGEGRRLELATLTCSHCRTVAIKNPLRTRERGHCFKCNHYVCDACAAALKATGICRPWDHVVSDVVDGKTPLPLLARDVKAP
jgi:hypothetical protein